VATDATLVVKKGFEELGHVSQLLRILASPVALLVVDLRERLPVLLQLLGRPVECHCGKFRRAFRAILWVANELSSLLSVSMYQRG
jgi:hypothetical protein